MNAHYDQVVRALYGCFLAASQPPGKELGLCNCLQEQAVIMVELVPLLIHRFDVIEVKSAGITTLLLTDPK